jgi:hypothetical protein
MKLAKEKEMLEMTIQDYEIKVKQLNLEVMQVKGQVMSGEDEL